MSSKVCEKSHALHASTANRHPGPLSEPFEVRSCNNGAIGIRNGVALGAVLWLVMLTTFAVLAS